MFCFWHIVPFKHIDQKCLFKSDKIPLQLVWRRKSWWIILAVKAHKPSSLGLDKGYLKQKNKITNHNLLKKVEYFLFILIFFSRMVILRWLYEMQTRFIFDQIKLKKQLELIKTNFWFAFLKNIYKEKLQAVHNTKSLKIQKI